MSAFSKNLAAADPDIPRGMGGAHSYDVYGISIRTDLHFPLQQTAGSLQPAVEFFRSGPLHFWRVLQGMSVRPDPENWREDLTLPDGSDYIRWPTLFECLISPDGRRIAYNLLSESSILAFETYLLGSVLSCALVKLGHEILHATAVVVDGEALALLGPSGHGKSTLAAAFLSAGYPVLTDDLLVFKETQDGILIPPGIPRIKLFPEDAEQFLPFSAAGVPMNPLTQKLVIPLREPHFQHTPAPLRAVYRLPDPWAKHATNKIRVSRMPAKSAFIKLLAGTFNKNVLEPARLKRHFEATSRLLLKVPVRSLAFQRELSCVAAVRDAIVADFRRVRATTPRASLEISKS